MNKQWSDVAELFGTLDGADWITLIVKSTYYLGILLATWKYILT